MGILWEVEIIATAGGTTNRFPARIVRSEGEIDRASRSVYLVAEVNAAGGPAVGLQPGLFVKASVRGRTIPDRARIPFTAFVDLERVAVVAPDETLQFRDVTVVFRDEEAVYISEGLKDGELICLTELPSMIQGLKVSPAFRTMGGTAGDEPKPETAP
jgi:multidrug efflux pump subunit AcrA (membrane-fusion protein)